MELRIISPHEGGFVKEIQWNREEVKKGIADKMSDYKNLVFTEDSIADAKKDRANLRKLKDAFETERKRVKKLCMEPYEKFEKEIKEVTGLIDEPIQLIDAQIKEVEQQKKEQKRKDIEVLFDTIGFQPFVMLSSIFDEKWLNASVPMSKIEEQMKIRMYQIGEDVYTIHNLPEFSFEAMEVYKNTLDLSKAIQEGQRLSDIQKKKKEHEEALARKKAEEESRMSAAVAEDHIESADDSPAHDAKSAESVYDKPLQEPVSEEVLHLDFRVWGTREQLINLRNYMKENGLKFGKVE